MRRRHFCRPVVLVFRLDGAILPRDKPSIQHARKLADAAIAEAAAEGAQPCALDRHKRHRSVEREDGEPFTDMPA
ncbi:hypothetical protein CN645_03615 [Burkholderia sp. IDO3]|nr:hypothetical protein DCN14_09160 [Burkholderia sp. IDO3]PCD63473.1 hypothetical protein CN645_03615 [Burkholderia sp. IDO3]